MRDASIELMTPNTRSMSGSNFEGGKTMRLSLAARDYSSPFCKQPLEDELIA
jgi:hypothetical protein